MLKRATHFNMTGNDVGIRTKSVMHQSRVKMHRTKELQQTHIALCLDHNNSLFTSVTEIQFIVIFCEVVFLTVDVNKASSPCLWSD